MSFMVNYNLQNASYKYENNFFFVQNYTPSYRNFFCNKENDGQEKPVSYKILLYSFLNHSSQLFHPYE